MINSYTMTTGFLPGAYVAEADYISALTERDELKALLAEYVRRARESMTADGAVVLSLPAVHLIRDLAAEEKEKP